jgi:hypothetical protein
VWLIATRIAVSNWARPFQRLRRTVRVILASAQMLTSPGGEESEELAQQLHNQRIDSARACIGNNRAVCFKKNVEEVSQ